MYKHIYTSESEESGETGAKATERTAQKEAERNDEHISRITL